MTSGVREPGGLHRPRLLAPLLDQHGAGVVVVIAPPGSGKTTLLSRAAALSAAPSAWHVAGPEDRSATAFVARVTRAAAAATGQDLGEPRAVAELARALEKATSACRLLLVLDDVHELEGHPAARELDELLRLRPPRVRIALGTRRPLAANTPRLMVSGELVELDHEALRFRSWEVEELFRQVYGEPLSPEAAAALTRRTGGWAAGLMLFHLSTSGKSAAERERAVADLGGRSRLLRSYLTRTVLDELDRDRREFLLATCTLGTLTGPLCDELLGREGSAAVLEELASRQFFTTLSEDGLSYRYHQVLQTLLEGLLVEERGTRAAAGLHARSAVLLEDAGLPREALRAYALAEDFASVGRMLQQSAAGVATDECVTVDADRDDPWLALVRARRLQRAGACSAAVAAYGEAEAMLDDPDFRRRCGEERAVARAWLPEATIADLAVAHQSTPRAVAQSVRSATLRVPPPDRLPSEPLAEGVVLLLAGEPRRAAQVLAHPLGGSGSDQLFADLARVVADLVSGPATDCVATLERVVLTAEVEEQPWVARTARGLQAAVLLVTSPEPWRAESCESLVAECERAGDEWGAVLLAGALGVAHVVRRHPDAQRWLDRSAAGARRLNAPVLGAWAAAIASVAAADRAGPDGGGPGVAPDLRARTEAARILARSTGLVGAEEVVRRRLDVRPHPAPPRRWVVRCLGPFAIERDGETVALPELRPLPRSLLLLLALHHGRDVHREVIVDQLWPGTTLDAAAHRLHAAASSVRRVLSAAGLGDQVLRRHGSAYSLHVDGAVLDVSEFEAGIRTAARCLALGDQRGALEADLEALEHYRGDLLDEVGPAEWVVAERERLRLMAANTAYSAGHLSLSLRPPAEALPLAQRLTVLDPLRDTAWALLAETQERMGDLTSAAATRREHDLVAAEVTSPRP